MEQFIPRHSHKYLMKKTLMNTKFQWLMKYVNSENHDPRTSNMSQLMDIKSSKPSQVKQHRRVLQEKSVNISEMGRNCSQHETRVRLPSSLLKRNTVIHRDNNNSQQENIFLNKNKVRNKSLGLNSFRGQRSNLLKGDESHFGKRTISKLKTEPIYDRSKTKERYL